MSFVELVENQGRYSREIRVLDDLAQEHPLGDKANPGLRAADIFEPDLITYFAAEFTLSFPSDPGCQQPGRQPPRLEDDDLPATEQATIQQHLRDLGGFAGAGRR